MCDKRERESGGSQRHGVDQYKRNKFYYLLCMKKYAKKAKENNNKKKNNKTKQTKAARSYLSSRQQKKKESSVIVVHLFADTHISVVSPLYYVFFIFSSLFRCNINQSSVLCYNIFQV